MSGAGSLIGGGRRNDVKHLLRESPLEGGGWSEVRRRGKWGGSGSVSPACLSDFVSVPDTVEEAFWVLSDRRAAVGPPLVSLVSGFC